MLARLVKLKIAGATLFSHEFKTWETILEVVVSVAVCGETFISFWLAGWKAVLRDCWYALDAIIVMLTLFHWGLFLGSRLFTAVSVMENINELVFSLRFILQPCRVLAAVSMVRRVHEMQTSVQDIQFDNLRTVPESPLETPQGSILTADMRDEISDHLPTWCRFREWRLAYSPRIHGASMQSFYHAQAGGTANVVILQDALGSILGGFSTEPLQLDARGYHGSNDCFVFSFGNAFMVSDSFRMGTTYASTTFNSPALTHAADFVIRDFECWQIGNGI